MTASLSPDRALLFSTLHPALEPPCPSSWTEPPGEGDNTLHFTTKGIQIQVRRKIPGTSVTCPQAFLVLRQHCACTHPSLRQWFSIQGEGHRCLQSSVHRAYVYIRYMCASGIFTHRACGHIRHMCASGICAHQTYMHIRPMCTLGMCASGICACQAYVHIRHMCASGLCAHQACGHQAYVCIRDMCASGICVHKTYV